MDILIQNKLFNKKPRVYRENKPCFCLGCGKKVADGYRSAPIHWCADCAKKNLPIHRNRNLQKRKLKETIEAYGGLFLRMFPKDSQMVCYCCGKPIEFSGSLSSLICEDCKGKEIDENPNYLTFHPRANTIYFNEDESKPISGESLTVFLSEYSVQSKTAPVNETSLNDYLTCALVRLPKLEKSDFIPEGAKLFCNGCGKPIVYENGQKLCSDCQKEREKKVNQEIHYERGALVTEPIPLKTFEYLKELSKKNGVSLRKLYVMIYLANKEILEEENN